MFSWGTKGNIGKKILNLDRRRLRAINLLDTNLKTIVEIIRLRLDGIDKKLQLIVDSSSNMGSRDTCRL